MGKQKKTKEDVWYFTYDLAQMHEFLEPESLQSEDPKTKSIIYFEVGMVLYILDKYFKSGFKEDVIKEEEKKLSTNTAKYVLKCFKAFIKKSMAAYEKNINGGNESAKTRSKKDNTTNN